MAASLPASLRRVLHGPHPRLPRPLDAVSEHWASLRPRVRALVAVASVLAVAGAVQVRVHAAETRWGGTPVSVLVAERHLAVGARATGLRRVALPPAAVPASAVIRPPSPAAVLALALPEGAVLTAAHLDARGPAAGLETSFRAVPVPVEEGWAITAGAWVDVWVLGSGEEPATLVARSRPVLDISEEDARRTALIGLSQDGEVGAATTGLALGALLLTHAPAPATEAAHADDADGRPTDDVGSPGPSQGAP